MWKNMKYGLIISVTIYGLIILISYFIINRIDLELIKMWGFGLAIVLFLGSFPLHKTSYHGGKVANPTYTTAIPPDDHLHYKIQKDFQATKNTDDFKVQGMLIWSSIITVLITILLAALF